MITVTAKSFIGGFDPLSENPPTIGANKDSVQRDMSTTTTTSTSNYLDPNLKQVITRGV
jgi:hypothetical protein